VTDVELRTWHSVHTSTDEMASATQTVDLVAMLVNFVQPEVFVEAGTYRGHLTLAVANILRCAGKGRIFSADTFDNFSPALQAMARQHPEVAERVAFFHGDFLTMLGDIQAVDMAYIDASSKENEHMRLDHANAVYAKLNVGGILLIDDTASLDWQDARKFRQWSDREGIHLRQHRGLTIIQKRGLHG
jgi:predicted O-methyltransferase YrrM